MDSEKADSRRRDLVRDIVSELLSDPFFERRIRELMLLFLSEQERVRSTGRVQLFIRECKRLGVRLSLRDDGAIMVGGMHLLSPEYRGIFALNREAIWDYLATVGGSQPAGRKHPVKREQTPNKKKQA